MNQVTRPSELAVTTTFTIEGYGIAQYLGVVRGITVRAPTIAQGIVGGLKNIIGRQIGTYAVVGLRYDECFAMARPL